MLEPRRIAARAAAEFIARQRGERSGETIGYRVRNDSRISSATKLEIVTEGILTRMIQDDPSLAQIGLIIFDEFHERSLHADLALALTLEVQRELRPDLRLIIMSATIDAAQVATLVGNAEVIHSPGKQFPVELRYRAQPVDTYIDRAAADTVRRALREEDGDILVFLPGRGEIQRTAEHLENDPAHRDLKIFRLHSEIPSSEQDEILNPRPGGKRRLILATNIAETSITIPNVRIVIDSGLMRAPRFNLQRGFSGLETISVSQASASQRAGRAGRQMPGVCYRMWTEREQMELPLFNSPEILHEDLASFLLELAAWNSIDLTFYALMTRPLDAQVEQARRLLQALGALDEKGKITTHGRSLLGFSLHPRLASMLIKAKERGLTGAACDVAALLENHSSGFDRELDQMLSNRFESLRQSSTGRGRSSVNERIENESRRLRKVMGAPETDERSSSSFGLLVALAYPERVAMQREANSARYLLRSGTGAAVQERSILSRHRFLAVAHLDGSGSNARIFLAEPISQDALEAAFADQIAKRREIFWDDNLKAVRAREIRELGSIPLTESNSAVSDEEALPIFCAALRQLPFDQIPFATGSTSLRDRSEWLRGRGIDVEALPNLSTEWLINNLDQWLAPFIGKFRKLSDFEKLALDDLLAMYIPYHTKRRIDNLAPVEITLPSGRDVPIDYCGDRAPSISARLQELFGQDATPAIAEGRIPLTIHLLSPAGRPLQVTNDLASFWKSSYDLVRKEMQGRYPKHSWPLDPIKAEPMRGTKRRHLASKSNA